MKSLFAACALVVGVPVMIAVPVAPAAAIPVFDPSNYAQNLLQAARALEQINNQISSLQNEAQMVQAAARNLERIDFPQLQRIKDSMERVQQLMDQAQAIDFQVAGLDRQVDALFPRTDAA